MQIDLTPEQEAWLKSRVASGEFASVAAAARSILDERMLLENDDLDWAKPLVEEAEGAIERGEVMTLDEHRARVTSHLAALKP